MSLILEFGKYKNLNIEDVYNKDINYAQWLYRNTLTKQYDDIYNFLDNKFKNKNLIYLSFGKYKNKSIDWVLENDKNYI